MGRGRVSGASNYAAPLVASFFKRPRCSLLKTEPKAASTRYRRLALIFSSAAVPGHRSLAPSVFSGVSTVSRWV
jgi:hypothetical protein